MVERLLVVLKFILAILLLPLVIGTVVALQGETAKLAPDLQHAILHGTIAYVLMKFFVYDFDAVYKYGQNIVGACFQFLKPLMNFAPYVIPIYTIFLVIAYAIVKVMGKMGPNNDLAPVFFAVIAFSFAMHIILTAQDLYSKDSMAGKPDYFFGMALIFIPLFSEPFDLAGKDLFEAKVISDRGKRRNVSCECNGWQTPAVLFKSANKLRSNMLGIRGGPSVPTQKQFVAGFKSLEDDMCHFIQHFILRRNKGLLKSFLVPLDNRLESVFHGLTEEYLGQLVHICRHSFQFAHRFLKRHGHNIATAKAYHMTELTFFDELNSFHAETGAKHAIKSRRRPAALNMTEHGRTSFIPRFLLNELRQAIPHTAKKDMPERIELLIRCDQLLPFDRKSFGYSNHAEVLASRTLLGDVAADLVDRQRNFRNENHVRAAGDPGF